MAEWSESERHHAFNMGDAGSNPARRTTENIIGSIYFFRKRRRIIKNDRIGIVAQMVEH